MHFKLYESRPTSLPVSRPLYQSFVFFNATSSSKSFEVTGNTGMVRYFDESAQSLYEGDIAHVAGGIIKEGQKMLFLSLWGTKALIDYYRIFLSFSVKCHVAGGNIKGNGYGLSQSCIFFERRKNEYQAFSC